MPQAGSRSREATAKLGRGGGFGELPPIDTLPHTFPKLTPAGVVAGGDADELLQREHVLTPALP